MENTDPKKFGIKIKEIRNQKGYSLRQVSNQSKIDDMPAISPSYWSLVERGERNIPKVSTLKRIAKGLRVDEEEVLRLAGLSETKNIEKYDPPIPSWANNQDKIDLEKFLDENLDSMTYGGEDLTEEEKAKVRGAMIGIFWDRHKHD